MITINSDLIRGHIDTIILKVLAEGDRYGYDIIKEIDAKSKGLYKLKTPTLYSCLKRLEVQGLVVARWGPKASGGRRKYYTLTENGKLYFDKNQEEWEFSRTIIDRLISEKDYDLTNSFPLPEDDIIEDPDFEKEFSETVIINSLDVNSHDDEVNVSVEQPVTNSVNLNVEADKPVTETENYPGYDEVVYDEFYQEDIERALEQLQFETAEVSEVIDEESAFNALFFSALSTAKSYADNAAKQTAPVNFVNDADEPELDYLENDDDVDYDAIEVIDTETPNQTEAAAAFDNTPPPAFIEKLLNKSFGEQPASSVMQQPYYDPEAESVNNKYKRPSITEEAVKSAFESPGGYLHPDYTAERRPRPSIDEDMYSSYFDDGNKSDYRTALANVFTPDPEFKPADSHSTEIFQNAVKNENRYLDGYVIKQHNASSNKDYKNQYYFYDNRLTFAYSRIMGILLLSISVISLAAFILLLETFETIDIAFIVGSMGISLLYPIIGFVIYKLDPMHRKRLDFDFIGTLFYKFLVFVICILLIITVNIVFLNVDIHALQKNLVTLLLPAAMAIVIPFSTFIYSALYKSKKYSVE